MWPYLVCFFLSCLSAKIASRQYFRGRKISFYFFSLISIIIPSILAGGRDNTIGTDVMVYGERMFNYAQERTFSSYMTTVSYAPTLYAIIVYIIAKMFNNIFWQYFFLQLMVVGLVYLAIWRNTNKKYTWIGMAIYYLLFYNYTLNIMKQSIALAILLFSYEFIQEKKPIKYLLGVIMASLFHSTAIMGALFYPMYIMVNNESAEYLEKLRVSKSIAKKYRDVFKILIILGVTVVTIFFGYILNMFSKYSEEFRYYTTKYFTGHISIDILYVLFMLPLLGIIFVRKKYYQKIDASMTYLFICFICGIILYQTSTLSFATYRISFYLSFTFIITGTKMIEYIKSAKSRLWAKMLMISTLFCYWYYYIVICKYNLTFPYTSSMFNIR